MLNIEYTEEQKVKIVNANKDYIENLKLAIANGTVDEFFASFGFKPRFLDLTEIILCYPNGENIILELYEYIMQNIRGVHIAAFIAKLVPLEKFRPLLVRDFAYSFEKALSSNNIISNNIINYMKTILELPNGDSLILPRLHEILNSVDPTLIFHTLGFFKTKPYFNDLILNNYQIWLEISRGVSVTEILETVFKIDEIKAIEYVKTNFNMLLKHTGKGLIAGLLYSFSEYSELNNLIKENLEHVIDSCNAADLNEIIISLDEKLNLGILKDNDIIQVLKAKLSAEKQTHPTIGAIIKSRKNDYLKTLLTRLLNEEKETTFTSIGDSSWSNIVFKIGSKVLKIGWIRNNPNCISHYRIINPELFEIIYDNEGNPVLYIEVQDFLKQDGITKEDIQGFYDDLEAEGYIYIDPNGNSPVNFGVLNKRNAKKVIDSQPVSESFKKKSLVLIDRDCVWHKNDKNINYMGRY